jgi:hypothetical protein
MICTRCELCTVCTGLLTEQERRFNIVENIRSLLYDEGSVQEFEAAWHRKVATRGKLLPPISNVDRGKKANPSEDR